MASLDVNNSSKVVTKILNVVISNALIYVLSYVSWEGNANFLPSHLLLLKLISSILFKGAK